MLYDSFKNIPPLHGGCVAYGIDIDAINKSTSFHLTPKPSETLYIHSALKFPEDYRHYSKRDYSHSVIAGNEEYPVRTSMNTIIAILWESSPHL